MAIMHSSEKMKSVVKYIQDQDQYIFLEPLPKMPCQPREITQKDWRRIMKNSGEFTRADIAKKYGLRNVIWIEKRNQVERARKERKRVLSDHKRMSKRQRSEWAVRSERLLVGGFPDDKHPSLRGHFRRDATDPVANDRPHWSTEGGAHLYYTKGKRWHLNLTGFCPNTRKCVAYLEHHHGMLPPMEVAWQYFNAVKFVERTLTVEKLSAASCAVEIWSELQNRREREAKERGVSRALCELHWRC